MNKDKTASASLIARLKTDYLRGKNQGEILGRRIRRACTRKRVLIVAGGVALFGLLGITTAFCWPRTVSLSYSAKTCVSAPTLLPSLASSQESASFDIRPMPSISVGSFALYSSSACVQMKQAPKEQTAEKIALSQIGNPFKKSITIQSGTYPKLKQQIASKPLSTKDSLQLELDKSDHTFSYRVAAQGKSAPCTLKSSRLSCDMSALGLAQGAAYDLSIERTFHAKPAKVLAAQKINTVDPMRVVFATISGGQVIYDAPAQVTIKFNKAARPDTEIKLENRTANPAQNIPVDTKIEGDTATLTFKGELPRSANLVIAISSLRAMDGAFLEVPFELPFTTSGGPKVKNISIGSVKVQPNSSITLTFDTNIAPNQNLAEFIQVEGAAAISSQGNRILIKTSGQGRCMPFTVRVKDGLKNEFGISGGSAWEFRSRTLCQTVFSIGSSVEGRSITGYSFGSGPSKIVYVGGTHGDEKSSVQILNKWIDQLELNPTRIGAQQTIIVIPNLNPDGYAANRRTNTNGVDLNRNFPSNSWKSGVTMPDKSYWPTGGGTAPLSEPESRALANYITSLRPRMVLTYHAAGNIAQPNGSGDSVSVASQYAQKSTVGYLGPTETGSFFEYDTTGAFEDWLHDKYNWPAVLVELKSRTSDDYKGHVDAMWLVAGI